LCHDKGAWLFQVRPDIMPYDHLSDLEMQLWILFHKDRNERFNKGQGDG